MNCAQARGRALVLMRVERARRDYTWPCRVPLDLLRRIIEREVREAAEMAVGYHLRTAA